MTTVYTVEIDNEAILANLQRLTNQIYKLLPDREENVDWTVPLSTIIEEFLGMYSLLPALRDTIFSLLCKLEGLRGLTAEEDFFLYRRTIFECLRLTNELSEYVRL